MAEAAHTSGQLAAEISHWRVAVEALKDLDMLASPAAWSGLEDYLRTALRNRLQSAISSVAIEAAGLETRFRAGIPLDEARSHLLRLRSKYLQLEAVVDFFCDALATRSYPRAAAILRGLDTLASDSMSVVLKPLGIETPPALVYFDKGLGASILRAGVRLWDQANPSPVAAIKVTHHNIGHPTALLHETGHQVAHLTGWNDELAKSLRDLLAPRSLPLAHAWSSWASEVGADVYAFALSGWAPLPALSNVVDGTTAAVYRMVPGDPHPFPWIRVLFNAALCRHWFGQGPWDRIATAWMTRHDPRNVRSLGGSLARASMNVMDEIVKVCTRQPMRAFGGRPLTALANPQQVSPRELAGLAQRAGESLTTSPFLQRRESLRIFSILAIRSSLDMARAAENRRNLETWLARMGGSTLTQAA